MGEAIFFRNIATKGLTAINSGERYFEGWLTVQVKDKQGEVTIVDELMKVLPIWIDRGAPISDTHSNRIIGKGINYSKAVYKDTDGELYPAIKITGKIHKNYELDNDIWGKIKSGEYKGLSFGGATKSDREPMQMKDGSIAYSLKDLEHYEVAVCRDPAVPLALITEFNTLAKAVVEGEDIGGGRMLIKCSKYGCYVDKDNKEAGLKAPEAAREALVYDDKTLDQPSETPIVKFGGKDDGPNVSEGPHCAQCGNEMNYDRDIQEHSCTNCDKKKARYLGKGKDDSKDAAHMDESEAVFQYATDKENPKGVKDTIVAPKGQRPGMKQIHYETGRAAKAEDWSNAGGDMHSMYNQDTDEGGMGKHKQKGCKCSDPKCKDPKCKHKREVGTGYGAEKNSTGEVGWSGGGSPYPKIVKSKLRLMKLKRQLSNSDADMSETEVQHAKRGSGGKFSGVKSRRTARRQAKLFNIKQAITTNVLSRLKSMKLKTEPKQLHIQDPRHNESVQHGTVDADDRDEPSKEQRTHNTPTHERVVVEPVWEGDMILVDNGLGSKEGIPLAEQKVYFDDDPVPDKTYPKGKKKGFGKAQAIKRVKELQDKRRKESKKDGEFGGMNTGQVEWTEPRDTANDRRDSKLEKKTVEKGKKKRDMMDTRGDKPHDDCPFCKLQQLAGDSPNASNVGMGSTNLQNIHTDHPREYHRLLSVHNDTFDPKYRKQRQDKKITEGMTSTFGKSAVMTNILSRLKSLSILFKANKTPVGNLERVRKKPTNFRGPASTKKPKTLKDLKDIEAEPESTFTGSYANTVPTKELTSEGTRYKKPINQRSHSSYSKDIPGVVTGKELMVERMQSKQEKNRLTELAQMKAGTWKKNEARSKRLKEEGEKSEYAKQVRAAQARANAVSRGEEIDPESDLEYDEDDT